MHREATDKLRLDRRLIRRRGWISAAELEKAFAELPDVQGKIAPPEDPETAAASQASDTSAPAPGSPRAE